MNSHRVVVTGLGAVTPLANNAPQFWQALLAGQNGIAEITRFDAGHFETRIAGEVKGYKPPESVPHKDVRRMARFTQFALSAALEALDHARIQTSHIDPFRIGVSIGCGIGGLDIVEEQNQNLLHKGPRRVSPLLVPMFIPNMAAGQVAIHTGAQGPCTCPVTACASAAHAIGDAFRIIQRGEADIMLAGGTEAAITPLSMAGFISAKTLSQNNSAPETASRPFDLERDGFVMGEGSGILVLESLEHAQQRQATIYAELIGYGMTNDAFHITAPDPEASGLIHALKRALKDGQIAPEQVGYINAHGTSTPLNDKTESHAIQQVFGTHASRLVISSTKSMTGHLLGAAGGIEAIATIMSLVDQQVHPTRNLKTADPDCPLDYVPGQKRQLKLQYALSNSMGFGGHNAVLAFARI